MNRFRLSSAPVDPASLRAELADASCGGYASFEGLVRNHNEGQQVLRLEYESYAPLALREGERIIAEARTQFGLHGALCVHRVGALELGEIAVWVGVAAPHRDEAFRGCRYIIDEVKHRLPIWKKEHYASGDSGWVNCERCAAGPLHGDHHVETAAAQGHAPHGARHDHGKPR